MLPSPSICEAEEHACAAFFEGVGIERVEVAPSPHIRELGSRLPVSAAIAHLNGGADLEGEARDVAASHAA